MEIPVKHTAILERDADGWWASRKVGEDNILGHGITEEIALADLEFQVAGFMDFLKKNGRYKPVSHN